MPAKRTIIPAGWEGYAKKVTFAPGVKVGNMVFVSGTTGVNHDTGEIAEGDIVAQTRQCLKNIEIVLKAAGASMADVVQTTDYILTTENYKGTAEVRREFFGDSFPVSTGIVVSGLLRPKALIEITAVAVLK